MVEELKNIEEERKKGSAKFLIKKLKMIPMKQEK